MGIFQKGQTNSFVTCVSIKIALYYCSWQFKEIQVHVGQGNDVRVKIQGVSKKGQGMIGMASHFPKGVMTCQCK